MAEESELDVRDLLKKAYEELSQRNKNRQIDFPSQVTTLIADDSDWHRSRAGYLGYTSAREFQFDGKFWIIARGEKCGSYPADPYDSDILALEFSLEGRETKAVERELVKKIGESQYFSNSLVYGMADGNLAINERGRFGKQMIELLRPRINKFIAQEPEYDQEVLSLSTLRPICKKSVKYKPEFASFLAETFERVLK